MNQSCKEPWRNIINYLRGFFTFLHRNDFRDLCNYILKISNSANINDFIGHVSSCLRVFTGSDVCCLVIKQGALLEAWANQHIDERQLRRVIQKDFPRQTINDYRLFDDTYGQGCHISDSQIADLFSLELKGELYVARLYILPKGGLTFCHPEMLRTILEAAQYALNRYLLLKKLENEVLTDHLTKCLSRRTLESYLDHDIAVAHRYGGELSVVIFDIDHFKNVNDIYGHLVGDVVLQEIVNFITPMIRQSDYLARWGGEEFVLVLPNTRQRHAILLAESIRHALSYHIFHIDGRKIRITASLGVATLSDGLDRNSLLLKADQALYQAKSSGRNRVCSAYTERKVGSALESIKARTDQPLKDVEMIH